MKQNQELIIEHRYN